jgi:hypothetical protein
VLKKGIAVSNPTLPAYLGSWDELVRALLNNPFLGGGSPQPHVQATVRTDPQPIPWVSAEPVPVPWRTVAASIIALLGTKQVAGNLPEGQIKLEMTLDVEKAIADIIDDWCGTRPRPWPPGPWPGPRLETPTLIAALGLAAESFPGSAMREDLHRVAGQIASRSVAANARGERKLPSLEEFDKFEFPPHNPECDFLCHELQDVLDDLEVATGMFRLRLLARLRAITARRRALNCGPCFFQ